MREKGSDTIWPEVNLITVNPILCTCDAYSARGRGWCLLCVRGRGWSARSVTRPTSIGRLRAGVGMAGRKGTKKWFPWALGFVLLGRHTTVVLQVLLTALTQDWFVNKQNHWRTILHKVSVARVGLESSHANIAYKRNQSHTQGECIISNHMTNEFWRNTSHSQLNLGSPRTYSSIFCAFFTIKWWLNSASVTSPAMGINPIMNVHPNRRPHMLKPLSSVCARFLSFRRIFSSCFDRPGGTSRWSSKQEKNQHTFRRFSFPSSI